MWRKAAVWVVCLIATALTGVDAVETVRVHDSGHYRVVHFDPQGREIRRYAGFGRISDLEPYDDTTVIVAEYGHNRLTALELDGDVTWTVSVRRPHCVKVAGDDRFFVCQHEPPNMVEVDSRGTVLWSAPVDLPTFGGAAPLADGTIALAGRAKDSVVQLRTRDGRVLWSVSEGMVNPQGVSRMPDGRLAVANFDAGHIVLLRPHSAERKELRICCHAFQVTVADDRRLWSASPEGQEVRAWDFDGTALGGFSTKYPALDVVPLRDGSVLVAEHAIPDRECLNVARAAQRRAGAGPRFLPWLKLGVLSALVLALLLRLPVVHAWAVRPRQWQTALAMTVGPAPAVSRRAEVAAYVLGVLACIGAAAMYHADSLSRHRAEMWPMAAFVLAGGVLLALLQWRTPESGVWREGMAKLEPMAWPDWRMWLCWALGLAGVAAGFSGIFRGLHHWEAGPWVAGILLLAAGSLELPRRERWTINVWVALAALVAVAALAALRFYGLDDRPRQIHQDMSMWGLQAKRLVDGDLPTLFRNGWAEMPLVGYLWSALFYAYGGDSIAGVRGAAAIGSLVAIAGAFLLVRRMYGMPAAIAAALLLGVNETFLHFSRVQQYMDPVPFAVLGVLCLMRGLESGRYAWFVFAGLLGGYSALSYHAGRITPIVMVALTIVVVLRYPRALLRRWPGLLLTALAGLSVIGAQGIVYLSGRSDPMGRVDQFLWYTHGEINWELLRDTVSRAFPRVFGSFWFFRDSSTQYSGRSHFFPPTAALLGVSVVAAFLRCWDVRGLLAVVWASAILFVGGVLTTDPPFYPRLVQSIVPVTILASLAVGSLWTGLRFSAGRAGSVAAVVGLTALLAANARDHLESYFRFAHGIQTVGGSPSANVETPQSLLGRDLLQWGADTRIYFVGSNPITHSCMHATTQFFVDELDSSDARDIMDYVPFSDPRRIVAYFTYDLEDQARALQEHYPQAERADVKDNLGRSRYYRVVVEAPHAAASQPPTGSGL